MDQIVQIGNYQEIQDILKTSALVIAILRSVFHVVTASVCTYFFIIGVSVIHFAIIFLYFLFDITSLPQDIWYIWATTSPDVNLEDPLTQLIGFGLALLNIVGVVGLSGLIVMQGGGNSILSTGGSSDPSLLVLLPQNISMLGSISYAIYIALN